MRFVDWIIEGIGAAIEYRSGTYDIYLANGTMIDPVRTERILAKADTAQEVCIVPRTIREGRLAGSQEACAVVVPSQRTAQRFKNDIPGLAAAIMMDFDGLLLNVAPSQRPSRTFINLDPLPRTPRGRIIRTEVAEWVNKQSILAG